MALFSLTSAGFNFADYPTVLAYFQNVYKNIYGTDIYLEPDSQDGQLVSAFSLAYYDTATTMAQVINSLSPTYAQGTQLSSEVLLNGISRNPATNSTVTLTLSGTVGTIINSASAKDTNGVIWNIANCTIGLSGTVDAIATCANSGAISALANTITTINTPMLGWVSVTNTFAATTGQSVESDAALRVRQSVSVAQPSQTNLTGLLGGILTIANVLRAKIYENYTKVTDSNGIPANSVCCVVDGGDGQTIADIIAKRKTIGVNAFGANSYISADSLGVQMPISFTICTYTQIGANITIKALSGYDSSALTAIKASLSNYINSLAIGQTVYFTRLYTYVNLQGNSQSLTFEITALTAGIVGGSYGSSDIAVLYNKAAKCNQSDIVITVI